MNIGKLNDWMQLIATFGVLIGLVFVGLQIRQDQSIALGDGMMAASQREFQITEVIGQAPDLWVKGRVGEQLSEAEQAHFDQMAEAWQMFRFSNWYRSIQIGDRQSAAERWVREAALDMFRFPGLREHWSANQERYMYTSPEIGEFDEAVEEELRSLESRGGIP